MQFCHENRWLASLPILWLLVLGGCSGRKDDATSGSTTACLTDLAAIGAKFEPWPAPDSRSCTVVAPISLRSTTLVPDKPVQTSCAMALTWARFEPEIRAIARAELGAEPVRLLHFGSYACRARSGNAGRMSEHATGRALDVAGFGLTDGREVLVSRDWRDPGPKGRFLRAVAAASCRHFGVVLTPASDRYHQDHIHFDVGPWNLCG